MIFTEEDIPLMKLIFNPPTHEMGMLVGQERAEEIFEYVCNETKRNKENFIEYPSDLFVRILNNNNLCDFFWDNNILQLSFLTSFDIAYMLRHSPIAKNIWDSGKLDLTLLYQYELEYFKQKFT